MNDPSLYLTPECTIVYPNLFEPSSYGKEEPTYSATFLISKTHDINPLRECVRAAAVRKWGGQIMGNLKSLHMPVRDGNAKAVDENGNLNKDSFYYNQFFIRAKSKWQPPVVNIYNEPITDPEEIYGGCIVQAYFSFYAYDYLGKRGIGCGLRAVCKIEDGEPIGSGRLNTAEVFNGIIKDKQRFTDSPPGYEEEVRGGYGEMGGPFPDDQIPPQHLSGNDDSDIPF